MMIARGLVLILLFSIAAGGAIRRAGSSARRHAPDIPSDATITLNREGVTVTIMADGLVLVDGQTFDFDISAIKMRISREQVQSLIKGFDQIGFFSLKDQYRDAGDDCSSDGRIREVIMMQTTSLTLNRRSKSVTRYPYECLEKDGSSYPRALVELERQIESVVNLHKR